MEKKRILEHSSYLLISKIFQFLSGLIKAKINAVIIGVYGVGLFNQLTVFTSKISNFSLLGINSAVVKQISEKNNTEYLRNTITSSLKLYAIIVIVLIVIVISILFTFHDFFVEFFFGSTDYAIFFLSGIVTIPFILVESIPYSLLQGLMGMKHISLVRSIAVIVNILVFVPLVYFFELSGIVIYFPLSYMSSVLIHFIIANKYYLKKYDINLVDIIKAKYNSNIFHENINFAGISFVSGIVGVIAEFSSRSIIINSLGIEKLGVYTPNIVWASLFTGFLLPSVRTYLFPRFCELSKDNNRISKILNDSLTIMTYFFLPLLFVIVPVRDFIIPLLYSDDFIEAGRYMPLHFLGVLFQIWYYQIVLVLTPIGRIKLHGSLKILYHFTNVLIVFLLVPKIQLWGWTLMSLIAPLLFIIIYLFILKKLINFKISRMNIMLSGIVLIGAFSQIVLNYYCSNLYLEVFIGIVIFSFSISILGKNQKNEIKGILLNLFNKIKRNK